MSDSIPSDPLLLLLDWVARQPDRPAVQDAAGTVSYAAFGEHVRRIAGALVDTGLAAPKVAIALPKGRLAYAAMFATMMAGGVYAPLNMDDPADRRAKVLAGFDPDVILTSSATLADSVTRERLEHDAPRASVLDAERSAAPLDSPRPRHRLAYVIFTSGSTGTPKGAMISRQALAHYVGWALEALAIAPDDRVSQHPNIGFDLSVIEIYAALCGGACLVPLTSAKDKLLPAEAVRTHGITVWVSVPSVIDLMRRADHMDAGRLASLRLLFFCGEPLLPAHLDSIFAALPDVRVINAYGPTEATVSCTARELTKDGYHAACRSSVAFGPAIPGMTVALVAPDGSPAGPEGGELVLSGPQLADGYWNDPVRTAAAFRERGGIRWYHTGDHACRINEEWFFENRIDRQVKIRGHRFELGEIDEALRNVGALAAHTVLHDQGRGEIVSFIEALSDFSPGHALGELRKRLPDYAIPARIIQLDHLPRNSNDKIDHNALLNRLAPHD